MAQLEIRDSRDNNLFNDIQYIDLTDGENNRYSIYINPFNNRIKLQYMLGDDRREMKAYTVTGLNDLVRDFFNFVVNDNSQLSATFARIDGNNIGKDNGMVNKLMSHYTVQVHDFFTDMEQQYNAMNND